MKTVFEGNYTGINNVVYALPFVAYRVRNNLFHSENAVDTLHLQKDLFETVNAFLHGGLVESFSGCFSLKLLAACVFQTSEIRIIAEPLKHSKRTRFGDNLHPFHTSSDGLSYGLCSKPFNTAPASRC